MTTGMIIFIGFFILCVIVFAIGSVTEEPTPEDTVVLHAVEEQAEEIEKPKRYNIIEIHKREVERMLDFAYLENLERSHRLRHLHETLKAAGPAADAIWTEFREVLHTARLEAQEKALAKASAILDELSEGRS